MSWYNDEELLSKVDTIDWNYLKKKKLKKKNTINLNGVWCIKDEDQRVLVKEEHIKEWFKSYIGKLLMEMIQNIGVIWVTQIWVTQWMMKTIYLLDELGWFW